MSVKIVIGVLALVVLVFIFLGAVFYGGTGEVRQKKTNGSDRYM